MSISQDAVDVAKALNDLYEITSMDGKWLNIEAFHEFAKTLPELIEKAQEVREHVLEQEKQLEIHDEYRTPEQQLREVGMSRWDFI